MNSIAIFVFMIGMLTVPRVFADNNSLGLVNLQLTGNIVEYSCQISPKDNNKIVDLGRWSTRGMRGAGAATQPVAFGFELTGCPPGLLAIIFSGKTLDINARLLALDDSTNAVNVGIELSDQYHQTLSLNKPTENINIDASGNANLLFFARYIALNDNIQPGVASASAVINIKYY